MGVPRLIVRLAACAFAALALAACSSQHPEDVRVSIGAGLPVEAKAKAKDYAALYAPYAMMATVAYTDVDDLDTKSLCPDRAKLGRPVANETARQAQDRKDIRAWVTELNHRHWQCDSGIVGSKACPAKYGPNCKPVGGLEYHVWRRVEADRCAEVAIAFRGTDRNDVGDWISNFRWIYRLAPKFDQYAQVQDQIARLVGDLKRKCGNALFVSAGHSLGGGLAQQAAYAAGNGGIKYVYAFDPSPVTGFFDISTVFREQATRGLGVDRAFESGEILVLPRLIIENIFPPLDCNPRIRSVRFNMLTGLPANQHSISALTRQLAIAGKARGADPKKVTEYAQARGCAPSLIGMAPPA